MRYSRRKMKNRYNENRKISNNNQIKKCKLRKYKITQAGITIIALVVTIIVLLILAGITISMATNNGVIGKAKQTADLNEEAQAKEEMSMYLAEADIDREQDESRNQTCRLFKFKRRK